MDSSDSISLLNQLILPNVELKSYYNPREYLKWFLEKSYVFFAPAEQLDFANVQYHSFYYYSTKDFINGILKGTPDLFCIKKLKAPK